jgi:hypothetical protein
MELASTTTALIISVFTIVSGIVLTIKWLVKHYLNELKPNSGTSIKDQISKLEIQINEVDFDNKKIEVKLDKMYEILLDYISNKK